MSEAKFTPGPWKTSPYSSAVGTLISTEGGRHLAAVMPQSVAQEAIANGRLVAAAPDLLAALRDLTNAAEAAFGDDGDVAALDFSLIDNARAAIAKAKGQA